MFTLGKPENKEEIDRANFEPMCESLQRVLTFWKMRILSMKGRICAVKAQALSQVQYLAMATEIPEEVIQEVSDKIHKYVAGGIKIPRIRLARDDENGGAKMPLVKDIIAAGAMHWIRRATLNPDQIWAKNIIHDLNQIGGLELFETHIPQEVVNRAENLGLRHVAYLLRSARQLQKDMTEPTVDGETPVFYNSIISTGKRKKVYIQVDEYKRLYTLGITRLKQFYDADGRLRTMREALVNGLPSGAAFEWKRMTDYLKRHQDLKNLVIHNNEHRESLASGRNSNSVKHLRLGPEKVPWTEAKQKTILKRIAQNRTVDKTPHEKRMTEKYNVTDEEWQTLYKRVKKHSNATKIRDFYFRWLSVGVYTNTGFVRAGVKSGTSCQYCKFQRQDFNHLFIECNIVNSLRQRIEALWEGDRMTRKDWIMGTHTGPDAKAKNYIAMELNRYVQITNWKNEDMSLHKFKSRLRTIETVERRIALKRQKIQSHDQKWNTILHLLN